MNAFDDEGFDALAKEICGDGCHPDPAVRALLSHCVDLRLAAKAAAKEIHDCGVSGSDKHPLYKVMKDLQKLTSRTGVFVPEDKP